VRPFDPSPHAEIIELLDASTVLLHAGEKPPDGYQAVDVVLAVIAVRNMTAAESVCIKGVLSLLLRSRAAEFRVGPSYVHVGAALDSQGYAFRLYALGHVCGLWKLVTPLDMGFDGDEARDLAGMGYVHISGAQL
jgi:hypothetical protein